MNTSNARIMQPVLPTNSRERYQHDIIDALASAFVNSGYDPSTSQYGLHVPLHDDEYVVQILVIVERKQ